MKCLKLGVIATAAAAFLLVPVAGTAVPTDEFHSSIDRGNAETWPGFEIGADEAGESGDGLEPRIRLAQRSDATPQAGGVTAEACDPATEPVLWEGPESQYYIKWCRKYGSNPKWAKKNYYYQFANGDMQLVATLKFDCDNPAHTALMPAGVESGACQ